MVFVTKVMEHCKLKTELWNPRSKSVPSWVEEVTTINRFTQALL